MSGPLGLLGPRRCEGSDVRHLPSWRGVAARLDLLRSTGPGYAWRRFRHDRALGALAAARRQRISRELWRDAALALGATVTDVAPGRFEIRRGSSITTVVGQTTLLNTPESTALASDKPAAYERLTAAGLPVPEHLAFEAGEISAARSFLAHGPVPCVVKPASGGGGDGVTGHIRSASELRRAVLAASRYGRRLLIERQLAGDVIRLLVLDGEVIDVVQRLRPSITGDGRSTVEELMFAEYDCRIRADDNPGLKPFGVDLDCLLALRHAGVKLGEVPAAGVTVEVRTVTNYNRPTDNRVLTAASPELCAEAVVAAAALRLRLAGDDVVTPTPAASLAASGGAIIDVNATPGLHHHAHVADGGGATRVTVPILLAL